MIRESIGPFATYEQAREVAAVHANYVAAKANHRRVHVSECNYSLLGQACKTADVRLGAYDHAILLWLAGLEPETCAVIAGLITRAHHAAVASTAPVTLTADQAALINGALDDAERYRRDRAEAWCHECQHHPAGACEEHVDDLDQADKYRDLADRLARDTP